MSYNDNQQNSKYLLNWINGERLVFGQNTKIYAFQQLKQSRLLEKMLLAIHPTFFNHILTQQFCFKNYFRKIQEYLHQVEDLRIKNVYKQKIIKDEQICEIVILILYLITKKYEKQEYVERILKLEPDTQIYLMKELKRIESHIENNMEIKEIVDKVQQLEQENENILEKLKSVDLQNKIMEQKIKFAYENNKKLININRSNNMEKQKIIQELGFISSKDYLAIYKDLQSQNENIIQNYTKLDSITKTLEETNKDLHEKLLEDNMIIEHLNEQIARYRQIHHSLKSSNNFQDRSQNKENLIKTRRFSDRSYKKNNLEFQHTNASFKNYDLRDEQSISISGFRDSTNDLVLKLKTAEATLKSIKDEMKSLALDNKKLSKQNKMKQRQIYLVHRQLQNFYRNYQYTISG